MRPATRNGEWWDALRGAVRKSGAWWDPYLVGPRCGHDYERPVTTTAPGTEVTAVEPAKSGRVLQLTSADTIRPKRVRWLWAERLPLGALALLAGRKGSGKSTFAYDLAARITRGELPGEYLGQPRGVLVCATEDSWEETIVPRLIAADADLARVYRVQIINDGDLYALGLSLPRDIAKTEQAALSVGAAMLLLDPLMSRVEKAFDTHRDGEVRQVLEPVAALAQCCGLAVVGIIHFNKSTTTDILDRIMASKAFAAVARSVQAVVSDPDDETGQRRLFGTPKSNLGRADL